MLSRFFQILLRTSDEPAARAFYASVLGALAESLPVVPLHEAAVARGARPHWLGFLEVPNVSVAAAAFQERGAAALAPIWINPEGLEAAVMRDPGGAIVALAKPPPGPRTASVVDVAWYLLNTADVEAAKKNYADLVGWRFDPPNELAGHGVFHPFAWSMNGDAVGSLSDIATRPGVHAHWLFHFRVPSLEPAVAAVRAGGGIVAAEVTLETGERLAVCDDPQGAAFALWQPGRPISVR